MWHLIERFSEDIDLAVDRSLFDLEGDLTKKQLKRLRKASSLFVKEDFCQRLQEAIEQNGLADLCSISAQPDGEGDATYPEPRKIFITYKSLWSEQLSYLVPVVMLEVGSRSLREPFERTSVRSIVEDLFPSVQTSIVDSTVATAIPAKTFLEKAFLIHELFSVEGRVVNANRKSRHLYDLTRMMDCDFASDAIADDALWESIRHHRETFTSISGVDYTPDIRKRIVLIPPDSVIRDWENDYADMAQSMIFGPKPSFAELLRKIEDLQSRFRTR